MKTVIKILAKIVIMPIWKLVVESSIRVKWLFNKLEVSTCGYESYAAYMQAALDNRHKAIERQKALGLNNMTVYGKRFVK